MFVEALTEAAALVRPVAAGVGRAPMDGAEAARVIEAAATLERLAVATRVLAARAMEASDVWVREGYRSAAAFMADKAKVAVGPAREALELARHLGDLPVTEGALREARLSLPQAQEIAGVALDCPAVEERLVEVAQRCTLGELKARCARLCASLFDGETRYRRIHRERAYRSWVGRDGVWHGLVRTTVDQGARIDAAVGARAEVIMRETRAAGCFEGPEAHRVDALAELVSGAGEAVGEGPPPTVHVWVDYEALCRGATQDEERCEIVGLGPVPVSVAKRLMNDCILEVVLTKGHDVTLVAHGGRTVPRALRQALVYRDPVCPVPRCGASHGLQLDHRIPWAEGGLARLEDMARLCAFHHHLKSHHGHTYRWEGSRFVWIPPEVATEAPFDPP